MLKSTQIWSLCILWDSLYNNFHPDLLTNWTIRKLKTIWLSRESPFLWTKRTRPSLKSTKMFFLPFMDLLSDNLYQCFVYWFFGCNMDITLVFRSRASVNRLCVCLRDQDFIFYELSLVAVSPESVTGCPCSSSRSFFSGLYPWPLWIL